MVWCLSLAILSLIIGQGADGRGKPEVVSVVGRAGESAVLGCDLLSPAGRPPLHVIEWLRFGFLLPIFIQFGLYSPRIDPAYVGRVRLQKGASLQIEGLRAEDQGWYECRVLFLDQHRPEDDSANGSWVHLTVNSPPQFLETPPQVLEVRELEPVTLRCAARGSPQPRVTWKLLGQDLGQGQSQVQVQNGTLRIRRVERGSSGVYTCQASSTEGSAIHATQLLVLGPPVIVVPPKNSTVNASQDVSLACQAEAYPANLTYSWFQDSTNVFHISRLQPRVRILVDGSLRLQAAQPDDAGRYTCVPSNGLPRPPSASAYLTVLYPAQVTAMPPETPLPMGMRGVIRCPVRANPPLLFVSWTKDGQALQLDKFPGWSQGPEGSLIIALGNEDVLGEYSCTPYNRLGTAGPSPVTRVLLKAPPAFLERPKEEYFQEVGRELLIPCSARGDPSPTISWAKAPAPTLSPMCPSCLCPRVPMSPGSLALMVATCRDSASGTPHWLPTTPAAPSPPATEMLPPLSPPRGLVAVRTARGVLLHWDPPELVPKRLDGYVLEARQSSQGWEVLDRAVAGSEMQLLVPGLIKDVLYEFRLVAFAGSYVSDPSNTANVSTSGENLAGGQSPGDWGARSPLSRGHRPSPVALCPGLEVYPSRTQLPGLLPQPVLAGVVGGVCFLGVAVLVSILAACLMNRRRAARRHRKRLRQDAPLIFSPAGKSAPHSASGSGSPDSVAKLKLQGSPVPSLRQSLLWGEPAGPPSPPPDPPPSRGPLPLEPICRGPDGRFVMGPKVGTSQEKSGPEQAEPRTPAQRQARSYDGGSSPSGMAQPLCIADIRPVRPPPAAPPSSLPGPGPLLQYLSLPFFREMNVDGDWPPLEEPAPPPDYMDTRPRPTSSLLHPLDSHSEFPRAALPGAVLGVGASPEPPYTVLTDWTLRERLLPSLLPAAAQGSLTSQSSGRGSASFLRPPSTAPSAGGSYLSPAPGDTSSWASGPERWPRREHVVTVSTRRNTSVDENYEWDSEFPGDMELLETLHLGLTGPRSRLEAEPELGAKTPEEGCLLNTAHAPGPEARCAALREEFLAFRRRRDAARFRLPAYRQPVSHPEQATLL
ncbi:protein turtle homolog A isoform X5 [Lagenorhynchus albirostris]|uniref:protein turtle homolog A isoform X5 n=1 Tax=Lagenorhynchus albirostris TaxID=27610 RepID=UPI0028E45B5F|nr:protein turtle homolog A isoform X5 [Lagenorhynchus albirostris]